MMSSEMMSTEPSHPQVTGYHDHAKTDHMHGFIERNTYEVKDELKALYKEVKAAVAAQEFT